MFLQCSDIIDLIIISGDRVMSKRIFNQSSHKQLRQQLRGEMPEAEKKLWYRLRNKQLGFKFRRQYGVGPYVVDFYCAPEKLVIELDGDSHYSAKAIDYDQRRNAYMMQLGLRVMRFTNLEVLVNTDGVLQVIMDELTHNPL